MFLYGLLIFGGFVFATAALIGLSYRRRRLSADEAVGLRLALEFSLGGSVLALIPFALAAIIRFESVVWALSSLVMAGALLALIVRVVLLSARLEARWPLATISLLVLSAILLTIEVTNVLWWQSLMGFAGGLLWMLLLAGIQLTAFVCYVPIEKPTHEDVIRSLADAGDRAEWMRRRRPAGDPDAAPDGATVHGDAHSHRPHSHRLAFTHQRQPNRRPIPNAAVRPNGHPRSR
jgi:hypothetical protein